LKQEFRSPGGSGSAGRRVRWVSAISPLRLTTKLDADPPIRRHADTVPPHSFAFMPIGDYSFPAVFDYIQRILKFIRFSHTIFALPFAAGSMIVAAHGFPSFRIVVLILLAMVFARTAAMAFNRVADWEIDKENPRTAGRHKLVSKQVGWFLVWVPSAAFILVAWLINPLCFALSPVALAIIFFYSLTKRFTSFTQFFLGLALAVSPIGAWLAVKGQFAFPPLVLAFGVVFWLVGFDLIYAIQATSSISGKD
jgi:4-hydroxybenzoate polyprenyltransferase